MRWSPSMYASAGAGVLAARDGAQFAVDNLHAVDVAPQGDPVRRSPRRVRLRHEEGAQAEQYGIGTDPSGQRHDR
ncbi:hypothetical protein [Nonomuraea dietziae]|uniref:hypothetical protein n=1 Tax=Nonomuraea dietziae TaxID=65515 RepID=UPI0031DE1423